MFDRRIFKVGERFRHYGGGSVTIVGLAIDENGLEVVVYSPEFESPYKLMVMPLDEFFSMVQIDGKDEPMFKRVSQRVSE